MQYLDNAFKTWNRMVDLGLKSTDILHTSSQIISHRTTLMGQNITSPEKIDDEIHLMSNEKVEAAALSSSALMNGYYHFSQEMLQTSSDCFLNNLCGLSYSPMNSGNQHQMQYWNALLNKQSTEILELTNTGLEIIEETLNPVHERVTNNAKRLSKAA